MLDQLSKNITRCGLSNSTLNYLRVSMQGAGTGAAPLELRGTRVVCLVLSAARCLAVLGHGDAGGRALQKGSCRWLVKSHEAVGLLEPAQHGLVRCPQRGFCWGLEHRDLIPHLSVPCSSV